MEKESVATEKGHQGAEENTAPLPVESVVEASVAAVADAAGAALDNAVAPDAEPVKEASEKGCDTNNSSSLVLDETKNSTVVIALVVSYKGEQFSGFARQPGQLTVQGELEEALSMVFRRTIEITCAGRTDSGVHARGQVVSFELNRAEWEERSEYKLLRSLNALMHDDIAIRTIEEKPAGFSARFSATMREYRYFISVDRFAPLFMRDFSWHVAKPLNVEAMNKAASYLVGEHDFKSFCLAASAEGKSTNRYVGRIDISRENFFGDNFVVVTVEGNAFLHSMVRTIVGTLVAVGIGNRTPDWVKDVLVAKNRSAAGENAPAKGLVFWRVSYEGERIHDPFYRQTHSAQTVEQIQSSSSVQTSPTGSFVWFNQKQGNNLVSGTAFVQERSGEQSRQSSSASSNEHPTYIASNQNPNQAPTLNGFEGSQIYFQDSVQGVVQEALKDLSHDVESRKRSFKINGPRSYIAQRKERSAMPEFVIPRGSGSAVKHGQTADSGVYGEVVMDEIADSFIDEDFFEDYIQSSAHAGEFDLSLETIEEELDEPRSRTRRIETDSRYASCSICAAVSFSAQKNACGTIRRYDSRKVAWKAFIFWYSFPKFYKKG